MGADRRFGLAAVGERARGVQRRLRHCDSSSTSSAAQSVARTAVAPSSMGLFAEAVDGHDGVADLVPRLICFLLERAPRLMCARQVGPPLRRNVHRLLPRRTGQRREWQPGSRGGSGPFSGRPLGHEASLAAWWLGALRRVSVFLGCDLTVKNDGSMARRSVASRNGPLGATYRRSCSTVRTRRHKKPQHDHGHDDRRHCRVREQDHGHGKDSRSRECSRASKCRCGQDRRSREVSRERRAA